MVQLLVHSDLYVAHAVLAAQIWHWLCLAYGSVFTSCSRRKSGKARGSGVSLGWQLARSAEKPLRRHLQMKPSTDMRCNFGSSVSTFFRVQVHRLGSVLQASCPHQESCSWQMTASNLSERQLL